MYLYCDKINFNIHPCFLDIDFILSNKSTPTTKTHSPSPPEPKELFGNSQNNTMGTQSKSFGGGSIIKPNPMYTFADFTYWKSNV